MIVWVAAEEFAFKADAEFITAEEANVDTEEDFMVDVDKEADMVEEAGNNWDINGPDPMPEWYSVTMARI